MRFQIPMMMKANTMKKLKIRRIQFQLQREEVVLQHKWIPILRIYSAIQLNKFRKIVNLLGVEVGIRVAVKVIAAVPAIVAVVIQVVATVARVKVKVNRIVIVKRMRILT